MVIGACLYTVRIFTKTQDDCCGEDPFECLKASYLNLKSKGL